MSKFHAIFIGLHRDRGINGAVQVTCRTFKADLGGPGTAALVRRVPAIRLPPQTPQGSPFIVNVPSHTKCDQTRTVELTRIPRRTSNKDERERGHCVQDGLPSSKRAWLVPTITIRNFVLGS